MILKSVKVLALGLSIYTGIAYAGAWISGSYKQWTYRALAENTYAQIHFSDGVVIQLPRNAAALDKCNGFNCTIYEAGPRKFRVDYDPQTGQLLDSEYTLNGN
ncbi:hypothetical protein K2X33_06040 [bacterium]|nr:hypothetical protein [bacterium]